MHIYWYLILILLDLETTPGHFTLRDASKRRTVVIPRMWTLTIQQSLAPPPRPPLRPHLCITNRCPIIRFTEIPLPPRVRIPGTTRLIAQTLCIISIWTRSHQKTKPRDSGSTSSSCPCFSTTWSTAVNPGSKGAVKATEIHRFIYLLLTLFIDLIEMYFILFFVFVFSGIFIMCHQFTLKNTWMQVLETMFVW